MTEMSKQLFILIFNRLSKNGQLIPRHIGEYDGIGALPKGDYPPIYSWIDSSLEGALRLSFNTPLLEEICQEEASAADIGIDSGTMSETLDFLMEESTVVFQKTINTLFPEG